MTFGGDVFTFVLLAQAQDYQAERRIALSLPKRSDPVSPYIRGADDAACNWTYDQVAIQMFGPTITATAPLGVTKPVTALLKLQISFDALGLPTLL